MLIKSAIMFKLKQDKKINLELLYKYVKIKIKNRINLDNLLFTQIINELSNNNFCFIDGEKNKLYVKIDNIIYLSY